jgi:HEAT repeat protein
MTDPGPGPGRISMNNRVKDKSAMEVTALSESVVALKKFQKPLVAYLISSLEVNDKWVRIMAAEMLGTIGDSGVAGHLKPLLADQDKDLRIIAAKSLSMIHSPKGVLTLTQADSCENCMIRLVAEEALEKLLMEKQDARLL